MEDERDPREIFADELTKIGVPKEEADSIALDAGSSQVIVNKAYLRELNLPEKVAAKAWKLSIKFYTGELF